MSSGDWFAKTLMVLLWTLGVVFTTVWSSAATARRPSAAVMRPTARHDG
jgi:hypothetical protein